MAKDLYGVLGVSKSASADELKQAYRKLSKEWHPDKHKGDKAAETKFKEINEAYETLHDPKKRQAYDQFGTIGGQGPAGQGGFGGFDFGNFANANFSGFGEFGDAFENFFTGSKPRRNRDEGEDLEITISISFADMVTGVQQEMDLRRFASCEHCGGNGAEKGAKLVKCTTCGGTGQVTTTMNSFFGRIQQRVLCEDCSGRGTVPEKVCRTCSGEGRVQKRERVLVDVPAGIADGQTLRVRNQGNAGKNGAGAGELYVHVRVATDPRFERDGNDIRTSVSVSVIDAILGGTVDVETVHGISTLTIPEGTQPNQTMRIKGKGLPELGSSRMGDHYVTIIVEIPKKLSKAERKIAEEWRGMNK